MDINFSICFLSLIFGQSIVCWKKLARILRKLGKKEFLEMKKENTKYKNKKYIYDK